MPWTGIFSRNTSDFFRALEGYFYVENANLGFSRPIRVVSATANQIVLRDFGLLGELTINGAGLTFTLRDDLPGGVKGFPQLTGGTITSFTVRFNAELDMLTSALALANNNAERAQIQNEINKVLAETNAQLAAEAAGQTPTTNHLAANAVVVPTQAISAAQLGTAAVSSFMTGSKVPMRDYLNQFTVNFAGPGAPGGILGQGFDLVGFDGADTLTGGPGNDLFVGNGGNDTMDGGGGGVDIYEGGAGNDVYILGAGRDAVTDSGPVNEFDIISYQRATSGVQVKLEQDVTFPGTGFAAQDTFGGIEGVVGSDFNDLILGRTIVMGDLSSDFLSGGAGDDTLLGGEGSDTLVGGPGFDLLDGGGNQSTLGNAGAGDTAVYSAGPNDVHFFNSQNGLLVATPRGGVDLVTGIELFSFAGQIFTLNQLSLSNALLNIGTAQADSLGGNAGFDLLYGRDGNDTLRGEGGTDILDGGLGDDSLNGGDGVDTLSGGDGADTIVGGGGDDFIFGGDTSHDLRDVVYGGDGNDSIDGGYGNDELRGDAGDDSIEGGFGVDIVIGGDGNDVLTGSAWSDQIFGGNGNDFINGGFGFDRVNGGLGADKFYHTNAAGHGSDWIQDYNAGEGDVLFYGGGAASKADFLVQRASTASAGDARVQEVFITHKPSGNLLWALVDGDGQSSLNVLAGGQTFDLLA
ncbi:calcium-binding protein [Pseudoprimorskyibacter insulae]|uniref:Bifunctional hemolysin/adenylate cyclase n=1 Tax=Pseudoprimorskyibacter insulae TaxID=1695997 RepID=A0A2R8AQ66_9RHOB|nr:calcium-binding protein [Pseudoprimorskyibacter insulae]SPF78201.1 Bifunctional hemolysin/adenylate cyclase [Pseudoprimorskyibacter insulae]